MTDFDDATEEPGQSTALATVPRAAAGAQWALARMSDSEFTLTMEMARKGRARLQQVLLNMMTEDVHYGVIPGTSKKVLLKPGGEVLSKMFSMIPDTKAVISYGDGVTKPHISVHSKCIVHLDDLSGPVVGVGEGSGNSWEKKWRYRLQERTCPDCGNATIIKGKKEYGGGWLCFMKKGGCGHKWPDGAAEIEDQQIGQIDNQDPYDLENTIVKIVNKRARMDAIITATASSDLLTQDLEEGIEESGPGGGTLSFNNAPKPDPAKTRRPMKAPEGTVQEGKAKGLPISKVSGQRLNMLLQGAKAELANMPEDYTAEDRERVEKTYRELRTEWAHRVADGALEDGLERARKAEDEISVVIIEAELGRRKNDPGYVPF